MKSEFKKAKKEIAKALTSISYEGDCSDIGNEIGIIIGKYIDENKMGWELDAFISGIKHGISIADGTHPH